MQTVRLNMIKYMPDIQGYNQENLAYQQNKTFNILMFKQ